PAPPTPMATKDAEPEPDQRTDGRGEQNDQPQRPREIPEEELQRDVLGVLHHEDDQQSRPTDRRDRSTAEPDAGLFGRCDGWWEIARIDGSVISHLDLLARVLVAWNTGIRTVPDVTHRCFGKS